MRRLATLAVVAVSALMWATAALGQDYTFGDWARDHGYRPGDRMRPSVSASSSSPAIDSLNGIGEFNWINTTKLTLSYNQLSNIESNAFSGAGGLRDLNLQGNQISSIESDAFWNLWLLESLNLHLNQLSSLESGVFSGLTNLKDLGLYDNQMSSIESGAFSGLTNLTDLLLGSNQLSSIESGTFSGLTNLDRLSLGGNQISSIESGVFSGLANLDLLSLGRNQISSLESGAFTGLTNLDRLSLGRNQISSIESGVFSGLTNLTRLELDNNQISIIGSGTFSGLASLEVLLLRDNQMSIIGSGAFSGLTNLTDLLLADNVALTELNLEAADFSSLFRFDVAEVTSVEGNANIGSVSLKNAVLNQASLVALMEGGLDVREDGWYTGIGESDGITEMNLSGVDFANITDLEPLYVMDGLTDLWLVNTQNLDATDLDVLLDNLETIEGTGTEGVLYMTHADFDAFNAAGGGLLAAWHAEFGHHVAFGSEPWQGDMNLDGDVNGLDVEPFVYALLHEPFNLIADMNGDGAVTGLDVDPFVAVLLGGDGGTQPVPEPSALLLALVALGVVGGWRKLGA